MSKLYKVGIGLDGKESRYSAMDFHVAGDNIRHAMSKVMDFIEANSDLTDSDGDLLAVKEKQIVYVELISKDIIV